MKEIKQISETNPMLLAYQRYLQMNYSSPKTRYLYESKAKNFLNNIYNETGNEPQQLTQEMLDDFVIWLNTKKTTNPFYRAWIQSFRTCFDPDGNIFKLKTKLDRSRERTKLEVYDWLPKESIDIIINKSSQYVSMMVSLYFDSGRRLYDIIGCDLNSKDWDLDLVKRTIRGISKNNTEYRGHFSKQTAKKIYEWIKSPSCINKTKPFLIYKKNGEPCANQWSAFDYKIKQETRLIGVRDVHGKEIHTHALRHSTGRYLGDTHNWKIESVAVKLGHKDINQTRKYISQDLEQIEHREDAEVFDK